MMFVARVVHVLVAALSFAHSSALATPAPRTLIAQIESLSKEVRGGAAATPAQTAEMARLVSLLEESQPREARSAAACQGTWSQIYCDNPAAGTTWGDGKTSRRKMIGRITGRVTQVVLPDEAGLTTSYQQRATFGRVLLEARLVAIVQPQPEDDCTWSVDFESFSWRAAGGLLPLRSRPMPPGRGGTWRNTYADETCRVMRAGNRRGDGKETLYVLRRLARAAVE